MDEKLEAQTAQLAAIDHATLTPLVQSALGSKTVEVANWEFEQLHGGIGAGTAVYRFSGQGRDQHQTIPWSLILKMLQSEGGSADASAWNYYRREVDAYQSGWTADLPGGLAAPRCFGVLDHLDGTCWMWIEDIRDMFASQWPLEHYHVGPVQRCIPGGPAIADLAVAQFQLVVALCRAIRPRNRASPQRSGESMGSPVASGERQRSVLPPLGRASALSRRPRPPAPDDLPF